ncbi:MAG: gamma-glutamylcyclotransferase [Microbacterium sp.]|uniref:gamma-glutamylcyclotransferase family protein n=1 Tax=Microbacterium sp. TaxID=51671 RepID=UPI002631C93B|nr:gamma-glutamylcyclotransferase family protein [Microbacterium sp.]MCX6501646.1 gamma-glutamylcyclotransferase [Microbacterium sp.]
MAEDATELLFVYGLLTRTDLQLDTFGRRIETTPDVLPGYRLGYAEFDMPLVAGLTGMRRHPVAHETDDPLDKLVGDVLELTLAELDAADEYAAPGYRRIRATLESGVDAWVFVPLTPPAVGD